MEEAQQLVLFGALLLQGLLVQQGEKGTSLPCRPIWKVGATTKVAFSSGRSFGCNLYRVMFKKNSSCKKVIGQGGFCFLWVQECLLYPLSFCILHVSLCTRVHSHLALLINSFTSKIKDLVQQKIKNLRPLFTNI